MNDIMPLRLFCAIVENGSIASGARTLNMSPSAASRTILKLELQFQVKLMQRSTRSLTLTEPGRIVYERTRQIIDRYDQMLEHLAVERGALIGHIRISVNDLMGNSLLPVILEHFRNKHRGLTFSVTLTDDPLSLLGKDYDIAIHAGSLPGGSLIGRQIYSYKRVVCASPKYIARNGSPSKPADLDQHDSIVHTQNGRNVWHFKSSNGTQISQPIDPVIETNSYRSLLGIAQKGLGLVRVGRVLVERQMSDGTLEIVMPDFECVEEDGTDPTVWLTYPDRILLSRVRVVADFMYSKMRETVAHPSWWEEAVEEA